MPARWSLALLVVLLVVNPASADPDKDKETKDKDKDHGPHGNPGQGHGAGQGHHGNATPDGLVAEWVTATVELTWNETEAAVSYLVYRNGLPIGGAAFPAYNDPTPLANATYWVTAIFSDGFESQPSNSAQATQQYDCVGISEDWPPIYYSLQGCRDLIPPLPEPRPDQDELPVQTPH